MNRHIATLLAPLALLLAANAQAGTLSAELEAAIEGMSPGDPVDVIIRCEDPLDPAGVTADELIPALRNKAMACETSLGEVLKHTALQPPRTLWIINAIAARVPVAELHGLVHRAGVDSIYLNKTVELPPEPGLSSIPNDPAFTYWNIAETRAPDLWSQGVYGTGVVVATLDSGVDAAHADLGPKWRGGRNSWYDPHDEHAEPHDASGHGTGVMGLMVAGNETFFDIGMAPDARWIAAKIFNDEGNSDLGKIHQAFQWILDPDGKWQTDDAPDIVNSSWVLLETQDQCLGEFAADIAALRAADIAVVFSAGNFGPDAATSMSPANDPGSLSVGATGSAGEIASFSSRGPSACDGGYFPRLSAPGKDVLTTGLTTGGSNPVNTAFGSGTSYAAPHVAGAMALLKSAAPGASMAEIEAAIEAGTLDLGDPGADNDYGAGLLDVVEAFYLLGAEPPPPSDTDQDGVTDDLDLCPGTPAGEAVDADGCSASQLDSDGDGVSDALDLCPGTPAGDVVDADGCTIVPPADSDGDGVGDALDLCPGTSAGEAVDANGCSASQLDADGDGVSDAADQCPNTPAGETVDANGCSASQLDSDADGVSDALDLCPGTPAGDVVDADGCTVDPGGGAGSIVVLKAQYNAKHDKLSVEASSDLGASADLVLEGYGPMKWSRKAQTWSLDVRNVGGNPGTVTVSGVEGSVTTTVQ